MALYSFVCERYNAELQYYCQRFSNNDQPLFTDQEAIPSTERQGVAMMIPVKAVKGEGVWSRAFNKAADDVFSRAVSAVRQPIESLFNWFIEHTDIQRASKVRLVAGLITHVFGKTPAALSSLI